MLEVLFTIVSDRVVRTKHFAWVDLHSLVDEIRHVNVLDVSRLTENLSKS